MKAGIRRCIAPILAALAAAFALSACSRPIIWEENVQLNTGEVIVVKRQGHYVYRGAPGNPLDFGYHPEPDTTIRFVYKGRSYSYAGDANLLSLAIGPDGLPNLIVSATDYQWQWKHNYYCAKPSYVQLKPDRSGQSWHWPESIEPWLYNLPTNLSIGVVAPDMAGKTLSQRDREIHNASLYVAGDHYKRIDPAYQHPNCKRKD